MRIVSGDTSRSIYFVAIDSSDGKTELAGLTSWTIYYTLDGGVATSMTTPTVTEVDSTNMPGLYKLAVDESGMVTLSGKDTAELIIYIQNTDSGQTMAKVKRQVEITANSEEDIYSRLGAPVGANISADIATVDSNVDSVLEDTNEMQGKLPANNIMGSSVKTNKDDEIDDIKSQTDKISFDGSDNVQSRINDKGVLNNPPSENADDYKADVSNLDVAVSTRSTLTAQNVWEYATRTLSSFGSLVSDIWSSVTRTLTAGTKDSEIDAIKTKTDNLPTDPASETNVDANETKIDALQSDVTDLKDVQFGKWIINKSTNVLTLYKQDGITVLKRFNLTDNESESKKEPQ